MLGGRRTSALVVDPNAGHYQPFAETQKQKDPKFGDLLVDTEINGKGENQQKEHFIDEESSHCNWIG